ncbi:MAG: Gfo/Idh/MocA family oxidoreductase [Alkalispirochaeta sp.]
MTYGFGIVGTGMIARHHARALAAVPEAHLAAVFSRDPGRAAAFAAEYGCRAYSDYAHFLDDGTVAVVSVCTPSGAHLESALPAARAGKHLIIEKPIEITLERCDQIIDAAEKHGVYLGGIFQSRFMGAARHVREAVDAGRFGSLVMGSAHVKWYRSQSYYDDGGWKGTQAMDGGGALMNQSIHAIDLLQWYMGPVKEVQAITATLGHTRIEVEDTAVASIRFTNGAVGVIEGSTATYPGFPKRVEISGIHGSAILEEETLQAWSFAHETDRDAEIRARYSSSESTGGAADPGTIGLEGHRRQFQQFIHAVDTRKPIELDGREARKSVAIIRAIYESAASGQVTPVAT